jgi:two-component system nitrogen regulation response regulator GlnG
MSPEMAAESVWVIDDDQSIRWVLERAFRNADIGVTSFDSADAALNALHTRTLPDAIISDIRMPGTDGISFLRQLHEERPEMPVIIMTAHSDLDAAVTAYEGGAFEYLPKPFDVDEVIDVARRACQTSREARRQPEEEEPAQVSTIIGEAPAMQEVFRAIGRLSRSNITVLINGESGTGKELIASALHRHSPRAKAPFIALNMAAIPHDLMESELFGHEKGAFTGATTQRQGRFEQANGGTLFLDEIGDMPAELQTRLLRVLADGQFYRVGGHTPVQVDVRIIAATHQNLEKLVEEKRFREDLFHRLNVIRIHAPPMRERREDIPLLLGHFLRLAASELEVEPKLPTRELEEALSRFDWPGNVRQLENLCRWLTVMASGRELHLEDLPPEFKASARSDAPASDADDWRGALRRWAEQALARGERDLVGQALPAFEEILIDAALRATGDRRQEAAQLLGWGRNTLTRKLKEIEGDSR